MQLPSTSTFDITEATDTFTIDGSGNGNNTLASDYNGNQTFDGSQFYTYDGWNRLMTVSHGYRDTSGNLQHGQASVNNSYDAKGRRIIKVVNNTGSWDCTYNYYYNGNQQIEQQNGSNQTIRQNVWGLGYIDNLIQTNLNSSPTTQVTCDTPYWVLQDANFNVLGILNSSGVLVERYEYSSYGQRTVYFSPGSNDPFCMAPTVSSQRFVASTGTEAYGLCEFGHQGLMHDEESGLVYNRARYLSPALGRFANEDPKGYVDGLNLFSYEIDGPVAYIDPYGTDAGDPGSVDGDPGYHKLPEYHSDLEGKPCCVRPAVLKSFKRIDATPFNAASGTIQMQAELTWGNVPGSDVRVEWWTCWRNDHTGGWIPGCSGDLTCPLSVAAWGVFGFGMGDDGPHLTNTTLWYMSCENGVWRRKMKRVGGTWSYERHCYKSNRWIFTPGG